jgi:hypothetical protein
MTLDLQPPLTTAQALDLFDRLPPVDEPYMLGRWRGSGMPTGHPLDGLLEAYRWWGKEFESAEVVHPLLFERKDGQPVRVNPALLGAGLGLVGRAPLPRSPALARVFQMLLGVPGLLRTTRPRARLRMLEFRGLCSASMVYDQWPIIDVFRRMGDDQVLGLMDARDMAQPFFFQLTRDRE